MTVYYVINMLVFLDETKLQDFWLKRRIFVKIWNFAKRGSQIKTVMLHFDLNTIGHLKTNNSKSCFMNLMR